MRHSIRFQLAKFSKRVCSTLKSMAFLLNWSSDKDLIFSGQASMGMENDLQKKKNILCKKEKTWRIIPPKKGEVGHLMYNRCQIVIYYSDLFINCEHSLTKVCLEVSNLVPPTSKLMISSVDITKVSKVHNKDLIQDL